MMDFAAALAVLAFVLAVAALTIARTRPPAVPQRPGVTLTFQPDSFVYNFGPRVPVGTALTVRRLDDGAEVCTSLVNNSGLAVFSGLASGVRYGVYAGQTLCAHISQA
jgi:hypothetical protein